MLYCKTRSEIDETEGGQIRSIADDLSNLTAKVDSRSTTKAGDNVKVALDIEHSHIFDKATEITLLARNEEDKAYIEELQAKRVAEEKAKAEEAEKKRQEEEAKAAAALEKKRKKNK